MQIGLIGGIGPAATDFYYRSLIERFASEEKNLDMTIVHADAPTLIENLMEETKNITKVIVSHRISTIEKCDLILVLENGKVIQSGKHADLFKERGYYRDTYNKQKRKK